MLPVNTESSSVGGAALAKPSLSDGGLDGRSRTDGFLSLGAALVRGMNRSAEIVAFEIAVVSFFVDAADLLGVPKSVAAIYGLCFSSAEPLSFADLDERLDISTGSISQGVRVLREVGALKVAGTQNRREYFTPDLELRKLAARFIEERLEKQLNAGKGSLSTIKSKVPAGKNHAAGKQLRIRLKYLQSWHDHASGVLPLVKSFLKIV